MAGKKREMPKSRHYRRAEKVLEPESMKIPTNPIAWKRNRDRIAETLPKIEEAQRKVREIRKKKVKD